MARPRVTESAAILDVAVQQLTIRGIAATTIDDVADAAGVSRATVYRYLGGKNEIVRAAIAREAVDVLDDAAAAIIAAPTASAATAGAVSTTLRALEGHPLLARLTTDELTDTLPYVTVDSAALISVAVSTLATAYRASTSITFDDELLEEAIEEATRFVFTHVTTPRRDGSRLPPDEAGARAAALVEPLLSGRAGR